jgi:hypothetical protein
LLIGDNMKITLFTSTVGDGPARLTISVTRNFDSSDAFTVWLGSDNWPLATPDAERLAAAGRRIEGTLDFCAQRGEPVEEAAYFRRQLGNGDGRGSTFELGIDASGPLAATYLEWSGKRIVDSSGRLLKMLETIGEAAATIRQAEASRRVQNLQLDLKNYRSPLAWDGRTPYDP